MSTNTGIAIQDYVTTDSAYVLVAPAKGGVLDAKDLLDKVFDIKGRSVGSRSGSRLHALQQQPSNGALRARVGL